MKPEASRQGTGARKFFRALSGVMLCLAAVTAALLVVLRLSHYLGADFLPFRMKSAMPLIFIGGAFGCVQFAVPRTGAQRAIGLLAASAFILWGSEQFVTNAALIPILDDIVAVIFVFDLGIVVYGHLKS